MTRSLPGAGFAVLSLVVLLRLVIDVGQPLQADDVWWHIALGRSFVDAGGFPAEEPLLFTSAGHRQFYQEWLFQIVVASIDRVGGLPLLRAVQVFLVLGLLQQVFMFARLQGLGRTIAIAISAAVVLFAFQRLVQFRPHLFSMIFFYAALNVYCVPVLTRLRVAYLFLIIVLWTNSHATVMTLLPFLFIYMLVDGRRLVVRSRAHVWGVVAVIAAIGVNPEAHRIYYFYFIHDRNNPLVRIVDEWGHLTAAPQGFEWVLPWSAPLVLVVFAIVSVTILAFAVFLLTRDVTKPGFDESDLHLLLWGILAIIAGAWAVRFLWMMPLALVAVARGLEVESRTPLAKRAIATAVLGLVLFHQLTAGTSGYRYRFTPDTAAAWLSPAGVQQKYQPHAVHAIAGSGYSGNLFTTYNLGGFVSFMLHPPVKVFLNSRYDGYPKQVYDDAFRAFEGGREAADIIGRYAIDGFLLPIEAKYYKLIYTLKLLGWCEGFHDATALWVVSPELVSGSGAAACPSVGSRAVDRAAPGSPDEAVIAAIKHHQLEQAAATLSSAPPGAISEVVYDDLAELCEVHRALGSELAAAELPDTLELCGMYALKKKD